MDKQPQRKSSLANWLDAIQQESWQLELLISGFAIFLLFGADQALRSWEHDLILLQQSSEQFFLLDTLYYTSRIGCDTLLGCLIVHVILRGLWIAAIGLRSVSGEIEYDRLTYRPVFVERLRKGVGSFDGYIERLERLCSILFTFAFLIIFCILSLSLYLFLGGVLAQLFDWLTQAETMSDGFGSSDVFGIFILGTGLIYAIDFITFGYLKKLRWLGKVYYYFYVFMGWITLAWLYRPLYYNLIDHSFGRKFARAVPICVLALLFLVSLRYNGYAYTPGYLKDGKVWVSYVYYDDLVDNPMDNLWRPSLASRYVRDNYVEFFIPYVPINDDELIKLVAPGLTPGRRAGFYLEGGISAGERNLEDADNNALLAAFRDVYQLRLNDSLYQAAPRFYYHPVRRQHGLLYPIPVHDLPPGEHRLRFSKRQRRTDTVAYTTGYDLYFYK
ncbi:MAG: hypothetical protein AAFZ52_08215 [Bacteroidota bacterium]